MSKTSFHSEDRAGRLRLGGYWAIAFFLLALGILVLTYLISTKPSPQGEKEQTPSRLVRAFQAQKTSHRVRITAYGTTRASEVWTAIAEVQGQASEVNPRFEPGELLPAGMLLVKIDPVDYRLAERRLQAEVRAKKEALQELNQKELNEQAIFNLQQRQLRLSASDYERQRQVFDKNALTRSALEVAESAYVKSRLSVQETRGKLALIPVQRELLRASLDVATTQLQEARRNLSKCEIRLPIAARCASKSIEDNQFISVGERLGTFLALDTTEVVAMVETRKMAALFPRNVASYGTLDLTSPSEAKSFWDQLQIPAEVRWALGERRPTWYGRLARIGSSLDPATRTVPVIIEVPDPYKDITPGIRPPLIPDVFCEVTLYGATANDVVLVPRDAMHNDDRVYLLRDGKLHIQPVQVLVLEEDMAVITQGISEGDLVILTDLFPASEGMPLRVKVVSNPVRSDQPVEFPSNLFPKSTKSDQPEKPAVADDSPDAKASRRQPASATNGSTSPRGKDTPPPASEGSP